MQLFNKVGKFYHSTEVFLFHKSNTRESRRKFDCLPLSHLKILNWFDFQLPTTTLV